ncbi:hypothetical protein TVAG_593050 [Trichomonas vaginalis G3]|uniref:Kinetoplast-associated protein n=1 Tax=Trichomonas vaginalis (strain ATCC PRA-98 / G3) TaxID=412133 RepID=A2GB01_TRIV3|nr:hypothetical protein TVAG_593050 [Trichomonas vaginalis G3]|eukprot:XP_001298598.1 hypothetical protein [Trichomonas vaginalis G3]
MLGRSSDVFAGNFMGKSKLEKIHKEAKEIIAQKNKEIMKYSKLIEDAENQLSELKAELQEKTNRINNMKNEDISYNVNSIEDEITALSTQHIEEMKALEEKHQEDMQTYKMKYAKSLKEAEQWTEQHIDTLAVEKQAKLQMAQQELKTAKEKAQASKLAATAVKSNFYQNNKTAQLMNTQRIEYLESQLSEITSLSREEIRDIRGKVEECLATITVRQKEYEAQIAKCKKELKERETKYNDHIEALTNQYNTEKARYQNQINAVNENIQNLTRVIKQMETHHEQQLRSTMKDLERMKTTIYASRSMRTTSRDETITNARETMSIQNQCMQMKQEIAVIKEEIDELNAENDELRSQLQVLDRSVYGGY